MNQHAYLLSVSVAGIKNIERTISLYFYKKSFNTSNFDPEAYRIKAIYGENGSGKTAIILGVHILRNLILDAGYFRNHTNQMFLQDVINRKRNQIYLECEYYYKSDLLDNIYKYCVCIEQTEADSYVISGEQLFVRSASYATSKYSELFSSGSDSDKTRPDLQSHFDTLKELASSMITSFDDIASNVTAEDGRSAFNEKMKKLERYLKVFQPELQCLELPNYGSHVSPGSSFIMNYGDYSISVDHESSGIRKLIKLYDYLDIASKGGIVFIDDLDESMNEVYMHRIVEFFAAYGKGQLCFTAHNTSLMSTLRNYRNSIDFLSADCVITPWRKKGNLAPDSMYRNGMVNHIPFNIEAEDLLGILG